MNSEMESKSKRVSLRIELCNETGAPLHNNLIVTKLFIGRLSCNGFTLCFSCISLYPQHKQIHHYIFCCIFSRCSLDVLLFSVFSFVSFFTSIEIVGCTANQELISPRNPLFLAKPSKFHGKLHSIEASSEEIFHFQAFLMVGEKSLR